MIKTSESDSSIAIIKHYFTRALSVKYFYLLCFVVFIPTAVLYNKYAHKVYMVGASISPVQNEASTLLSSNELFRSIGTLQTDKNIENEINNLKSFALVKSTITKMNLQVSYYNEKTGFLKQTTELYGNLPYIVNIDRSHPQPIEAKFYIKVLNNTTFRITSSQDKILLYNYVDNQIVSQNNILKIDTICKFNETISNKLFKFSISFNKDYVPLSADSKDLNYFTLHHLDILSLIYLRSLNIERVSPLASIITIHFSSENEEKTINFLNNFLGTYLEENLDKKNKIALSTVEFIDSQISEISDSLVKSESTLRNYRSANQVMDLSFQGKSIYEQMTQIETERANLQSQERYYNYIINYFKTNNDVAGVAPPSSRNVTDPIMNQLITELQALNSQRASILTNNSEKNLFLDQIENKIKTQKQTIIENVTNNLNTLSLSINELNYRSEKLSRQISQLPKTELNMVSMQRKFNVSDVLYTYLLQKRSEAAITLASNYPDYEILEPARVVQSLAVIPKKKANLLISIFLSLLIPTIYVVGKDLFKDTITSFHEIENFLNRSIIAIIYSNEKKTESVVKEYPGTPVSESFRNLRSNLFLKLKSESSKVILITSSLPGDGKSFISVNLAASIASVGYSTILIDCDLRRPTLHSKLKIENQIGLTNYITKNVSSSQIICSTDIENLSFIPAGPVMPNPSELLESGILDNLINSLKERYQYIIIDTTPIGLVADPSLLIKYSSHILLISRNNYTRKDIFANVVDNFSAKQITNYDVVYNDLNFEKSPYKKFGSYYVRK